MGGPPLAKVEVKRRSRRRGGRVQDEPMVMLRERLVRISGRIYVAKPEEDRSNEDGVEPWGDGEG